MGIGRGESVGGFRLTGPLPELGGLSGGAFGSIALAVDDRGVEAVVKRPRRGDAVPGATVAVGQHHPQVAYAPGDVEGSWEALRLDSAEVAEILRAEAEMLERANGVLLPNPFRYTPTGREGEAQGLVMERLRGRRPETWQDVGRVLESLARAQESGFLDFHGDLKPEHIFLGPRGTVRLVDPAPRLGNGRGAFTPEYNPYGLRGPRADVFALSVILYELIARVQPFVFENRPRVPLRPAFDRPGDGSVDRPAPVARGRVRPLAMTPDEWERVTTFVDAMLGVPPDVIPDWGRAPRPAFERLMGLSPAEPWLPDEDGGEQRQLRSGVVATRLVNEDGICELGFEAPRTGDLAIVMVEGDAAWFSWGPLNANGEYEDGDDCAYTPKVRCPPRLADQIVDELDRLPYYRDDVAVGRRGSAVMWCGQVDALGIVLTDTSVAGEPGVDDRGNGRVIRPESLNRHRHCILVEADFGLSGIWEATPGRNQDSSLELEDLPLGPELRARLQAWSDHYETQRDRSEYPPEWTFGSAAEAQAFVTEGAHLTALLQAELGPGWHVAYTPRGRHDG